MARQTLASKTIGGKYAGPAHRAGAGGNYDWADELQNGRTVIPSGGRQAAVEES